MYYLTQNTCFDFLYNFCLNYFILRRILRDIIKMYISLYAKCLLFCQTLIKLEFSQQIFEKSSNIKLHENPSSGSQVVPRRQTKTDR
jgi:hypothetical protein